MGTRSRVAVANPDGIFTSIYVHWDGYPSGVGATLAKHYTDPTKAAALMALGNLSSLGKGIGEKHDFDNAPDDQCTAYGRDRGELGCAAEVSGSLPTLQALANADGADFLYVFQDGAWFCQAIGRSDTLRPLAQLL